MRTTWAGQCKWAMLLQRVVLSDRTVIYHSWLRHSVLNWYPWCFEWETGRIAGQEVMWAENGSVNLINHFCSARDVLLSNADPLVWWHMLIKNVLCILICWCQNESLCACVCMCLRFPISVQHWYNCISSVLCVWMCVACTNTLIRPFLFMSVPNVCMHGAVTGTAPNLHINFPHLNTPLIGWWWW